MVEGHFNPRLFNHELCNHNLSNFSTPNIFAVHRENGCIKVQNMKKPTATVVLLVSKHMVLTPQFHRESLFGKKLERGKNPKVLCKDMTKAFEIVTKECNLLSSLLLESCNFLKSQKILLYTSVKKYSR